MKLYVNGKLAVINGKRKGTFNGVAFDNTIPAESTWTLNERLNAPSASGRFGYDADFTCGSESYKTFTLYKASASSFQLIYSKSTTSYKIVYKSGTGWQGDYRTITFAERPTGDLLAYLQANGAEQ